MAGTFNIDLHSVLNTIDAVMAENDETNEWLEALKYNVNNLVKNGEREYNRGLEDCWEMIKKIYLEGVVPTSDWRKVFPKINDVLLGDILRHYTPQEAIKRIEEYEIKKKEEEEGAINLKRGDIVECISSDAKIDRAIYLGCSAFGHSWVLTESNEIPISLSKDIWMLRKTAVPFTAFNHFMDNLRNCVSDEEE